ncbi:MAG: iron-containing alcohol dehydrogenase [Proteobacteria bacterium]|nr:iron-containing alcohol dehydrogenase [Pseudomonadota bacterium]
MRNFTYFNPVKIVFGKGSIASLSRLLPGNTKLMIIYGGGSIKKNGVYDQVTQALSGREWVEFSGIESNPEYETCKKALEMVKSENVDFLLAIGGGSVIDATKFIAAASMAGDEDTWKIMTGEYRIKAALPFGTILTLPGTGSEMNNGSVISRRATKEKLPFMNNRVFPQFSILDPETTYSLPKIQIANGIADAYVHVVEQYLTYPEHAPLQDRQSEGILLTLMEEAKKILKSPRDYDARANIMWCAANALNGLVACGVAQDWTTHMIGHELTAHFGLDHAQSLTIMLPALLRHQKENKEAKLIQYAKRIFRIDGEDKTALTDKAIDDTETFFKSLGLKTRLSECGITLKDTAFIPEKMCRAGFKFGEKGRIGIKELEEILDLAK